MTDARRVAIVGGGVIGLSVAYFLRCRGAEVALIDRGRMGAGASQGNAGWISPSLAGPLPAPGVRGYALRSLWQRGSALSLSPRWDPAFARWLWMFWRNCNKKSYLAGLDATAQLSQRTMSLYDQLEADGLRFDMWRTGLVLAFRDIAAARHQLRALSPLAEYGYVLPEAPLAGDEVRELEPALSSSVAAAFLLDAERHVQPAQFTTALKERLSVLGATLLEQTTALDFERVGERITGVKTSSGVVSADSVVLAGGAWTGQIAKTLGVRVPLQAGKGYSFTIRPGLSPRRPLYLSEARIGVSPFRHDVRVAGTMELSGLNENLDPRRIRAMVDAARPYLADWPDQKVENEWVGLRPLAPDGLPIMGRVEPYENVYLTTGHGMLGVTLAPASGESMAELVLSGSVPRVLEPFSLSRL